METNQCISSINGIRVNGSNALYQVDDDTVAVSEYESVGFVSLNKNEIIYVINNISANSFTVLRDKKFLLMSAFGEGFLCLIWKHKKVKW